jgi:hypothetical protein
MARFILDVANLTAEQIKEVYKIIDTDEFLPKKVCTIICIDETNENQFHDFDPTIGDSPMNNKLSETQIENYNKFLESL